jgi:sulfur relay protein TusB/DsrH
MKSTLFVMVKGPHESCDLDLIHNIGGEDRKAVILFEDAVYFSTIDKKADDLLARVDEAYVISDDLGARGVADRLIQGFEEIDYSRAVDLIMEEYDQTVTI